MKKINILRITKNWVIPLSIGAALVACGGSNSGENNGGMKSLLASTAAATPRQMENLGRGVVAVRSSTTGVLVSWRLLGLDPAGIGFNVYRSTNGGTTMKLNSAVLTDGTNYSDSSADLTQPNAYFVRPVIGGVEQAASAAFTLSANHLVEPIVRIPLSPLPGPGYETKFVWVGDLDGDGEYDYVIDRLAPLDLVNNDIGLGNQYLEAYKSNGTLLWRVDMGAESRKTYNIHPGATTLSMGMYDGVTVYDLDGDGKAEVVLKIADGVKFPDGTTFHNADTQHQFVAILDGMTGKMLANTSFPTDFEAEGSLGTQFGIGYPDGVKPSIYFWGRNRNPDKSFNDVFASWSWNGGSTITQNWKLPIPASMGGINASHQMRIIDVDGDGKDEMATGGVMVNSDGTIRYKLPGVIHGDRFYIAKMDPNSPDMQGYGIQQNNPSGLLEYYYNATTGAVQWRHSTTPGVLVDVGRGLIGDLDPRKPGYEVWSFQGLYNGPSGTLAEPNTALQPYPTQSIWWDGDVLTEGLNDSKIEKWNPNNPTTTNSTPRLDLLSKYGAIISNHNPMFIGDIFGDWRTEVIAMNSTYTELMIFTTNIPSTTRAYTMAHNPAYRNHMTIKGYMQSPMLDYYFGSGMSTPPRPNIRYVGASSSGTIQAENAALSGGAIVGTDRAGFNGTGFVNFPGTGGVAQFNNVNGGSGGTKTITIRYSNGSAAARTGKLVINGAAQNITFPVTGGWTNWATQDVTVTLKSGIQNTLLFESTGQDLANLDEITLP